jgi:hypothetical protein
MKPFIYVSTLFSISFSVSNAWISDGGSTFCDKTKLMKLKDDVKECKQLAYQNFLEEKLAKADEFKARCDYLDYQVGYFLISNPKKLYQNVAQKQPKNTKNAFFACF